MKTLLLVLFLVLVVNACTSAEKVKCLAAAAGCGIVCACDFPACECCPACIACVTATVADCCNCLFPGWSGCNYKLNNLTERGNACASCQCTGGAGQICCPDGQMATCKCVNNYNPFCACV